MKSLEDLAKSIRSRLSQMARQKKVTFKDIETEFLLERLVVRLVLTFPPKTGVFESSELMG